MARNNYISSSKTLRARYCKEPNTLRRAFVVTAVELDDQKPIMSRDSRVHDSGAVITRCDNVCGEEMTLSS
jgi:hypothetical protein